MPEYYSVSDPQTEDFEEIEEVPGERLFSWRNMIFGLLVGGLDYANDVNRAIEEAYAER